MFTYFSHKVSSPPQGDGPEKKITRLAIGIDGGFNPELMAKKFEFEDFYNIIILPSFTTLPWPNTELPPIVRIIFICYR
jgi:ubiquitin carboxyl-terminal hydrolase 5/13